MGIHARLFGSMQYHIWATACLSTGAGTLRSVFVLASVYMHRLSLCALRHNNGSDVCASTDCPGETVHLPRLVWVVDIRITDLFVLIVCMCFKKFCDFVPEVEAISCLKKPISAQDQVYLKVKKY